eukprot:jgi/Hompol1/4028/HPOL_003440-RA
MPLFKRMPSEPAPPPPADLVQDPATPVYYIPYTGEIFIHYDDYLARVTHYRRKIWSCEVSGRSGLTFQEAIESELKAKQTLEDRFPRVWNQPVLERIHFNQLALNDLVDDLYDYLRSRYFVGEIVYLVSANDKNVVDRALVMEQVDSLPVDPALTITAPSAIAAEKYASSDLQPPIQRRKSNVALSAAAATDPTDSASVSNQNDDHMHTNANGNGNGTVNGNESTKPKPGKDEDDAAQNAIPIPEAFYRVRFIDKHDHEVILSTLKLRRDRQALSKQTLKKYIREVAAKDKWIGAPWYVKTELVQQYNLATNPPEELQEILDRRSGKTVAQVAEKPKPEPKKKSGKSGVNFPIEDLDLYQPRFLRTAAQSESDTTPVAVARPIPSEDFGIIPQTHVLRLISVWSFLTIYGTALKLYPFTFDDFVLAIAYHGTDQPCELLEEIFGSLISLACSEWTRVGATNTSKHPLQCTIPSLKSNAEAESKDQLSGDVDSENPVSDKVAANTPYGELMAKTLTRYELLQSEERIAVDLWFKWCPGRWAPSPDTISPPKRQRTMTRSSTPSVSTAASSEAPATLSISTADRLKAWEVALVGLIKDWMPATNSDTELKWRSLAVLLSVETDTISPTATGPGTYPSRDSVGPESTHSQAVRDDEADQVDTTNSSIAQLDDGDLDAEMDDVDHNAEAVRPAGAQASRKRRTIPDSDDEEEEQDGDKEWKPNHAAAVSLPRSTRSGKQFAKSQTRQSRSSNRTAQASTAGTRSRPGSDTHLHTRSKSATMPAPTPETVPEAAPATSMPQSASNDKRPSKKKGASTARRKSGRPRKSAGSYEIAFDELCRLCRAGFAKLSVTDRIEILAFLIEFCLIDSDLLRQSRDRALDEALELRKEMREVIHERKLIDQSLNELNQTETVKTEEAWLTRFHSSSIQMSRVQKLKLEQRRRELEERRRRDEAQRQREISKEQRQKLEERRKLEDRDRQLHRREWVIDHLLRIQYGIVRLKPLGRDRFHNR